ncbi:MAG: hypothetical protein JO170_22120, partial [Verrucomicrobia bacterium]|nr:hypothetical protein [Verrucomicrobiota bacterium]
MKILGYHVSAVAILLLSLSTALIAQDVTQDSTKVLTPLGYRDRAHVHQIPEGYDLVRMADGHMRAENALTGDHIDFADSIDTDSRVPFTDNGWITYASWLNRTGKPVSSFNTTWTVPPAPSSYDGQTLFQFNSIEPNSGTAILQPVLQYGPSAAGGGEFWAVASWYVTGNNAYYSSLVTVSPSETLTGVIKLSSHVGTKYNYTCAFTGISGTNFSIKNIAQLTWCTETLEVYGVDLCSEFPNTAFSQMSRINVRTKAGTP